jgi:hypothetical protein
MATKQKAEELAAMQQQVNALAEQIKELQIEEKLRKGIAVSADEHSFLAKAVAKRELDAYKAKQNAELDDVEAMINFGQQHPEYHSRSLPHNWGSMSNR